jgi:hypothetical protein
LRRTSTAHQTRITRVRCARSRQLPRATTPRIFSSVGSRPVSRVLSGAIIPLGLVSPRASSSLPGSACGYRCEHRHFYMAIPRLPYLALLQVGFAVPPSVATGAVRSYRTLSPLPAPRLPAALRRFAFCCTFRGLAPPRRYLAPHPQEPGLSSPPDQRLAPLSGSSDCPADSPRAPYGACAEKQRKIGAVLFEALVPGARRRSERLVCPARGIQHRWFYTTV